MQSFLPDLVCGLYSTFGSVLWFEHLLVRGVTHVCHLHPWVISPKEQLTAGQEFKVRGDGSKLRIPFNSLHLNGISVL